MYGGHITDDWDRRLCKVCMDEGRVPPTTQVYLEEYMHPDQLDGELLLAPGSVLLPSFLYHSTTLGSPHRQILTTTATTATSTTTFHRCQDPLPLLAQESPHLYGLHPNAEIGFLTATSEKLFKTVFELQPRESGSSGGATSTREEKVKTIVDDISEKMPDQFNMHDIMQKCEERTPYVIVCFQVDLSYYNQIPCTVTMHMWYVGV